MHMQSYFELQTARGREIDESMTSKLFDIQPGPGPRAEAMLCHVLHGSATRRAGRPGLLQLLASHLLEAEAPQLPAYAIRSICMAFSLLPGSEV